MKSISIQDPSGSLSQYASVLKNDIFSLRGETRRPRRSCRWKKSPLARMKAKVASAGRRRKRKYGAAVLRGFERLLTQRTKDISN